MFHDPKFWLAIAFFMFVGIIIKYGLPAILKSLDNKSKQIADELAQAKLLKEQAEKLFADAKKYHDESLAYSQHLIDEAKDFTQKLLDDSRKSAEEEVNKKLEIAKARISQEEENVIREIKSDIVLAAIKIVEDKTQKLSNNSTSAIATKAIVDIGKTIH